MFKLREINQCHPTWYFSRYIPDILDQYHTYWCFSLCHQQIIAAYYDDVDDDDDQNDDDSEDDMAQYVFVRNITFGNLVNRVKLDQNIFVDVLVSYVTERHDIDCKWRKIYEVVILLSEQF